MLLMGIDVGTTGCKVATFSDDGTLRALEYTEYDIERPRPGHAELNAQEIWPAIESTIERVTRRSADLGTVTAISVTSMGENLVPVDDSRAILGPSILNIDQRGAEYVPQLRERLSDYELYRINGNVWGNQFSLPKLMWIRDYQPGLYERATKFLHWGSFVLYKLGAEAMIDYSLANRSLLFDINTGDWSTTLLEIGGIDRDKLPAAVSAGTVAGEVSAAAAAATGLPAGTPLVVGTHDQCANALGCGVVEDGMALYGMGTFPTIAPVYSGGIDTAVMVDNRLNTEHHAVPGKFVSFLFHMGGSSVKWFRQQFAPQSSYDDLFNEMPDTVAPVLVLPRFAPMGPPRYEADASAIVEGLTLESSRGDLLRGIVEANTLALKMLVEQLPPAGIQIDSYVAAGGGSKSDRSLQIAADILGKPIVRSGVVEAGAFGAALLSGIGTGQYSSAREAVEVASTLGVSFDPDAKRVDQYEEVLSLYKELRETMAPLIEKWVAFRGNASVAGD
ncbi:MAG: FGGY family carbohydrate kinase [Alkalispirochaeta sp.]